VVRRRIKSVAVTPEEIGLCGCWRLAAVERTTIVLNPRGRGVQAEVREVGYYVCSASCAQLDDARLLQAIVGHWEGLENGTHRVRDVSLGEDRCRVARPRAARNLVALRNLAIGLDALACRRQQTRAPSLPSWQRSMRASQALRTLTRQP
jgi:hypothetical protein